METIKNSKPDNRQTDENRIPENLLTPVEPTLVANMERVVELATNTHLGEAFNSAAQPYLAYIAERMSLTERQALLLSLFLEKSSDRQIMISDFAQMLECRTIRIISLMSEVDALVARIGAPTKQIQRDALLPYAYGGGNGIQRQYGLHPRIEQRALAGKILRRNGQNIRRPRIGRQYHKEARLVSRREPSS